MVFILKIVKQLAAWETGLTPSQCRQNWPTSMEAKDERHLSWRFYLEYLRYKNGVFIIFETMNTFQTYMFMFKLTR